MLSEWGSHSEKNISSLQHNQEVFQNACVFKKNIKSNCTYGNKVKTVVGEEPHRAQRHDWKEVGFHGSCEYRVAVCYCCCPVAQPCLTREPRGSSAMGFPRRGCWSGRVRTEGTGTFSLNRSVSSDLHQISWNESTSQMSIQCQALARLT